MDWDVREGAGYTAVRSDWDFGYRAAVGTHDGTYEGFVDAVQADFADAPDTLPGNSALKKSRMSAVPLSSGKYLARAQYDRPGRSWRVSAEDPASGYVVDAAASSREVQTIFRWSTGTSLELNVIGDPVAVGTTFRYYIQPLAMTVPMGMFRVTVYGSVTPHDAVSNYCGMVNSNDNALGIGEFDAGKLRFDGIRSRFEKEGATTKYVREYIYAYDRDRFASENWLYGTVVTGTATGVIYWDRFEGLAYVHGTATPTAKRSYFLAPLPQRVTFNSNLTFG